MRISRYRAVGPAGADPTKLCSAVNRVTGRHRNRAQVAVQRIRVGAVVDDDKVAKAGKGIGKGHCSRMDGVHDDTFGRHDLDAIAHRGVARASAALPERTGNPAWNRPRERAAERRQRDVHPLDRTARSEVRHLLLQSLVCELCVEIPAPIDLRDQGGASLERAIGGRPCLLGFRFPSLERREFAFEPRALLL